jgi:hypothetical protein
MNSKTLAALALALGGTIGLLSAPAHAGISRCEPVTSYEATLPTYYSTADVDEYVEATHAHVHPQWNCIVQTYEMDVLPSSAECIVPTFPGTQCAQWVVVVGYNPFQCPPTGPCE